MFNRRGAVLGSIAIAFSTGDYRPDAGDTLVRAVVAAGEEASAAIRRYNRELDLPARTVNGGRGGPRRWTVAAFRSGVPSGWRREPDNRRLRRPDKYLAVLRGTRRQTKE